jgi:ribosomal protein L37E
MCGLDEWEEEDESYYCPRCGEILYHALFDGCEYCGYPLDNDEEDEW